MTFECRVQGEFDKVLAIVEDRVLSTAEDIKQIGESSAIEPDYRSVVRVYNRNTTDSRVDVNLILVQTGSDITISMTTSVSSGSDFDEDGFIDSIRNVIDNYTANSVKEDEAETKEKAEPLILLTSRAYTEHKDELLKGTYEHAGEHSLESRDRWVPGFCRKIEDALKERGVKIKNRYNYVLGAIGLFPAVMGGWLLVLACKNMISLGHEFFGLWLSSFIRSLIIFLPGFVLVFGPTQALISRRLWNKEILKFRGWHGNGIRNDSSNYRITNSSGYNQMLLYDKHLEIYLNNKLMRFGYENMECIFETENWFVVMVDDNDIFSFAKCDISAEEEELVRKILTPYYERGYKIVESEDSLFKDM